MDEQAGYFAREAGLETALRFYDAAASTFAYLAPRPELGERWETRNPRLAGLRVWRVQGFEGHLGFYRPIDDGIEIVRVLRGARDVDRALGAEPPN